MTCPLLLITRALACAFVLVSATWTQAQTVPPARSSAMRSWTVDDGLPYNIVWTIAQTPDGYLWVGTRGGLVRFDGDRFTRFDRRTPGLASSDVRALHVDADGILWIGTSGGGLSRYSGGTFTSYRIADGLPDDTIWSLASDPSDGALWIGTLRGLVRRRGGTMETFDRTDGLLSNDVRGLAFDSDGILWINTYGGRMQRWIDRRFVAYAPDGPASEWAYSALVAPGSVLGGLWRGQADGSSQQILVPDGSAFAPLSGLPALGSIRAFARTLDGTAWLGVYGDGLIQRAPDGTSRILTQADGLADDRVTALYQDRDENLWIGTMGGLTRLRRRTPITTYGRPEGLPDDKVRSFAEYPDGTLWIATDSGVARIDSSGTRSLTRADGLPDAQVQALLADESGVWFGSSSAVTHLANGRLTVHRPPGGGFQSLARTPDGALWIGAFGGGLIRMRADSFEVFGEADGLASANVSVLLTGRDGRLWIGTEGGLSVREGETLRTVTPLPGLPGVHVRSLHEDADSTLWLGTVGMGVVRLRGADAVAITTDQGLYDDGIWAIVDDQRGNLWMSGDRGLFRVARSDLDAVADGDRETLSSVAYGVADGMRDSEANGTGKPSGLRASDGRLWFATQGGAVAVDPSALSKRPPIPIIEQVVTRSGTAYLGQGDVELPLGERDVEVSFTAPDLVSADQLRFRYRLDGYDDDWSGPNQRRSATYTNLDPGPYTFRVQVAPSGGEWSADAAWALSVPHRIHETRWFAVLSALLALTLLGLLYRARISRVLQRERELEARVDQRTRELNAEKRTTEQQAARLVELDQAKSRFFTNVSHEFRTPLTLSIGPLEDLERLPDLPPQGRSYVDLALRNSRRMLRLINQLLDVARLEAGELRLDSACHDLAAFVRDLARPFAPLAERRRIRFDVETPPQPVAVDFDPDKLEQVVANLLSNAFKFTPEGGAVRMRIEVDASADSPVARVAVRDSGPGIAPAHLPHLFDRFYQADATSAVQSGSGIGLSLARDLAHLHGGTLTVQSDPGFGATFTLTLPLSASGVPDREDSPSADIHPEWEMPPHPSEEELDQDDDARTTVLVADDSADIRSYVRGHLETAGYRVVEAADGVQALKLTREVLPDLVVSDVTMPLLDGLDLTRRLRADPETDFLPILLLTARATTDETVTGLSSGADDYLTKPFDMSELLARIAGLIASRRRLTERLSSPAPTPAPSTDDTPEADTAFLTHLLGIVHEHLSDEAFGVEDLAAVAGQNRSTLYRRLRDLRGQTPSTFLRHTRLDRAAELLTSGEGTVSEVAYAVGFKSVSHFSQAFRRAYGVTPSAYANGSRTSGADAEDG